MCDLVRLTKPGISGLPYLHSRLGQFQMNQALARQEPFEAPSILNRRLAAVAFADVASFSRLMALNDVETLHRWKLLRTEVIEPNVERYSGRVSQTPGDAVLVEFPSIV